MKRKKRILLLLVNILMITFCGKINVYATSETNDPGHLIETYAECINNNDVETYISLFASNKRDEMKEFINLYSEESFFVEDTCDIIKIEKNTTDSFVEEMEVYSDVCTYTVVYNVHFRNDIDRDTCFLQEGINVSTFILVYENQNWFIERISENNVSESQYSSALSTPYSTVIYFTKSDNRNYWGYVSHALLFESEYLKNVLPKEWLISRYNNHAYAYASSMASKNYAWYYTLHPKWYCSPYYSCMMDNSNDQNYYFSSYDDLNSTTYQGYLDNALAFISNKVMVKNATNTILEIHYDRDPHAQYSGYMNVPACWTKANAGDSYEDILHYYYDYSGSNPMQIVTY